MPRIALGIEYDGSGFCGWQSQVNGGAVQDALERALARVAATPVRVHCAGRTDTGVHALQQVVHFDTEAERPDTAWVRGVNAHLPPSVCVLWAKAMWPDFHARFSAVARSYRYLLLNRSSRPGLHSGRVGWYHRKLETTAMRTALSHLVGQRDFSSFRAAECQAKSPVRTIAKADLERIGDLLVVDITADGFLHHMIRNIIGTLIYVGNGRLEPDRVATLLESRDRRLAPPTFAPDGLYFSGACYDDRFSVPKVSLRGTAPLLLAGT